MGQTMKISYPLLKKFTGHRSFLLITVSSRNVFIMFETSWCCLFADDKHIQFFHCRTGGNHSREPNLAVFTSGAPFSGT